MAKEQATSFKQMFSQDVSDGINEGVLKIVDEEDRAVNESNINSEEGRIVLAP